MKVKHIGRYIDEQRGGREWGVHIEAVHIAGSRRFQSISSMLLSEDELEALQAGDVVDLDWLAASDLLPAIDS